MNFLLKVFANNSNKSANLLTTNLFCVLISISFENIFSKNCFILSKILPVENNIFKICIGQTSNLDNSLYFSKGKFKAISLKLE